MKLQRYLSDIFLFVYIEDDIIMSTVFEIKLLFCAPSGRTGSYNVHPAACPCTPLVYSHNDSLKKRAHTGRTALKNVRPPTEMCAPGAVRTLNFEHWSI